jgi:hypothetical protein
MKTHVFVICLLSVLAFSSCEDEELTFKRTDYTGNEIRTDGCYYRVIGPDSIRAAYIFYYRNGIVFFFADSANITSIDQFNSLTMFRNNKTSWRVFTISENNILISQGWGDPWGHRRPLVTSYAKIINDTTILWYKQENTRTGTYEYNSVVNFREFCSKPDSTNVFIK